MYWIVIICIGFITKGQCLDYFHSAASSASNEFALELLRTFPVHRNNQFFSPLSISTALSMLSLGAKRNTLTQIKNTLHIKDIEDVSSDEMVLHKVFQNILTTYGEENSNYCMRLANRLFAEKYYEILPEFLENIQKYYNTSVSHVDFKNGKSEDVINRWVEKETEQKIKNIFAPRSIPPSTVLALVNAVYFKGTWKNQFSQHDTRNMSFYLNRIVSKNVPMMSTTGSFHYTEDEDLKVKVIQLPYAGDDLSMVVVLPEIGELPKLINDLNATNFKTMIRKMEPKTIKLKFPKFKMEKKYALKNYLRQLKLKDLFSYRADLSGISKQSSEMSSIVHKSFLDINEKGTEAAAATSGIIRPLTMFKFKTIEFVVNRSFFFAIIDRRFDDLMLFAGTVICP